MVSLPVYALHGLGIRSDVPLQAPVREVDEPDIDVHRGADCPISDQPPKGRVLARFATAEGTGYTHTETDSGYILRFNRICEFRVSHDRRLVTAHLAPGADAEFASLLLAGNVLAFLLMLEGKCVLHASAASLDDLAIAFVGAAGMGKSTLAALLCAAGAELVTDDLLRLSADSLECFPGTREIRLRTGAASLLEWFPAVASSFTVDQRVAIRPDDGPSGEPRLHAIIVPRPSRTSTELRLKRLGHADALLSLLRYPRVLGVESTRLIAPQFAALGRVAARVPVFEADIPWGPPFAAGTAELLAAGVGLTLGRHRALLT
jgi:hypothetical protein